MYVQRNKMVLSCNHLKAVNITYVFCVCVL